MVRRVRLGAYGGTKAGRGPVNGIRRPDEEPQMASLSGWRRQPREPERHGAAHAERTGGPARRRLTPRQGVEWASVPSAEQPALPVVPREAPKIRRRPRHGGPPIDG